MKHEKNHLDLKSLYKGILYILNQRNEVDSFDVSIDIKILFFRVLVTIEPSHFLLTVRYCKLFDNDEILCCSRHKERHVHWPHV